MANIPPALPLNGIVDMACVVIFKLCESLSVTMMGECIKHVKIWKKWNKVAVKVTIIVLVFMHCMRNVIHNVSHTNTHSNNYAFNCANSQWNILCLCSVVLFLRLWWHSTLIQHLRFFVGKENKYLNKMEVVRRFRCENARTQSK